jgi:hypothetical protein
MVRLGKESPRIGASRDQIRLGFDPHGAVIVTISALSRFPRIRISGLGSQWGGGRVYLSWVDAS